MSAPIGPGDWLECIGDWPALGLAKGSIWQCDAVIECSTDAECEECGESGGFGLLLRNSTEPMEDGEGWCPCGFRPIYRPNSEIIQLLKQPAPERELEDA